MELLKKKILEEGSVIGSSIVKVDGFINHRIDTRFLDEIGKEFGRRFDGVEASLILTIESSGIAIAVAASKYFGYAPVVFGKKTAKDNSGTASTMTGEFFSAECRSFTKGTVSLVKVNKSYIKKGDRVLILDDFLAHGEAASALCEIVREAEAETVGVGAVIEKSFQGGSAKLRESGIRVESLAVIKNIEDGVVTFE